MKKILPLLLIICTVFVQCNSRGETSSHAVVGDDSLLASDNELVRLLIENTQAAEDEDLRRVVPHRSGKHLHREGEEGETAAAQGMPHLPRR